MFGVKYSRTYYWIITVSLAIFFAYGSFHIVSGFINSGDTQMFEDSSNALFFITYIVWLNTLANRMRDYGSAASRALYAIIPPVAIYMFFYYGIVRYKKQVVPEIVEFSENTSV